MNTEAFALSVLDALPDATAVLDRAGTIVGVNHTWRVFCTDNGGRPAETGTGINYLDLCDRSAAAGCVDAGVAATGLRSVLAGDIVQSELEYPCPSPTADRWFLLRGTVLTGPVPGAVVSHVNITRRKMAEAEVAHEAAHDPLTGLANRTLLTDRLTVALTPGPGRSARADVGLLYLDLDGFKAINDTYGHQAGDEVLLTTAYRIRGQVLSQDTVARLGGDEFVVVADGVTVEELASLARAVDRALREPHLVHGRAEVVPASVGTHLAIVGDDPGDALHRADLAMYDVKRQRPGERPTVRRSTGY